MDYFSFFIFHFLKFKFIILSFLGTEDACPPSPGVCEDITGNGPSTAGSAVAATAVTKAQCLDQCIADTGTSKTACEWIQSTATSNVHTDATISQSSDSTDDTCWIFSTCLGTCDLSPNLIGLLFSVFILRKRIS